MNDKKSTMTNEHIANLQIKQDEITMIESFAPLILLISICIFPIHILFLIGLFLYSLLFIMEVYLKRLTPVCILILSIFLLLSVLYFIFHQEWCIFYAGSFFYFPLALMSIVLLAAKRPFTIYYSGGKGMLSLHYTISIMWAIIYVMSAIGSIVLIPDPSFVCLPLSLIIIGSIGTVIMNLFYFGPLYNRKDIFNISQYCFKEVGDSDQSCEDFYSLSSQEIWSTIIHSTQKTVQSRDELKKTMQSADKGYEGQIVRFVAYHNNMPIGTIFCVIDGHSGLPIERDTKLNMDHLRKIGRIMEVGHFTIKSAFRFKPDIFIGLFKAAIDIAVERDVVFLLNCPYEDSISMYQKLGFMKISTKPISDTIIGATVCALALNLGGMVTYHENFLDTGKQINSLLNPFLTARYYKRQIIKNIFRKSNKKQYNFKIEQLVTQVDI